VGRDVRFYVQGLRVVEHAAEWRAERVAQLRALREGKPLPGTPVAYPPLPEAVVEARCPGCGFVIRHGEEPVVRCPKCGDESVPSRRAGVGVLVRAVLTDHRMSDDALNAEIQRAFPIGKRRGASWMCGACGAPIETVGVDPLGAPEFAPCPGCGLRSTGGLAQSRVFAYARIDAALLAREEGAAMREVEATLRAGTRRPAVEAPPPRTAGEPTQPRSFSVTAVTLAVCAVAFLAYLYAADRSEQRAARFRPPVFVKPPPMVPFPEAASATPTASAGGVTSVHEGEAGTPDAR
jgi:rubrerythrin